MRSIHISLMLYGFIPLMLSYLPFLLINKEVGVDKEGLRLLNLYTIFGIFF
jgi:cytochrome c oxidase cbb3-type subunit 1